MSEDLSGPGPSRRDDPWTSEDIHDKATHRRIVIEIISGLPDGGNAYEVWMVWNRNRMVYGCAPPSQNHVNGRLGELIDRPGRPVSSGGPFSRYRVDGHPYLVRPGDVHPTGTPGKKGLVYYLWGREPRRKRIIPRQVASVSR